MLGTVAALCACKPPPTDADLARTRPEPAPTFPSDPLPSPETEGALWALSPQVEGRILYGIPGEPALLSLECVDADGAVPMIAIARLALADEGAGAMMALIGNGHIERLPVDASDVSGRTVWRGAAVAYASVWEPLTGLRPVSVTVPGAGKVEINPSPAPRLLIEACRDGRPLEVPPPAPADAAGEEPNLEEPD